MKIRYPAVAGAFYEGTKDALIRRIEWCFKHKLGPGKLPEISEGKLKSLIALVCPHAGYMYSGPVAAHAYYRLALDGKPDSIVLLGPNHTGFGSGLSIMREGVWRTPLGDVEIDTELADRILENSEIIDVDDRGHTHEHSLEVQLPFLQYLYGRDFKIVPICFLMQDLESSIEVGLAVTKAVKDSTLIIASSDFTHYEPQRVASEKDGKAIEAILKMDIKKFYAAIEEMNMSICGYGPIAAAVTAAERLGVKSGELLCYKTSGDVTGDFSAVVGYASIAFSKV